MHEKKSDFIPIKDFSSTGKLISQVKKLWKDKGFRKALEQKIQGPAFGKAGALLIKQIAEGGK